MTTLDQSRDYLIQTIIIEAKCWHGVFSKWGTHRDLWGLIGIVSKSKSFVLVGKQDLGWIKKLIQNYSKVFITIHEQKLFRISDKSRFSHVIFDKKRLSYPSVYDQIPFLTPTQFYHLHSTSIFTTIGQMRACLIDPKIKSANQKQATHSSCSFIGRSI